ncbi:MAG: OprO/OprP family phosphate-selective porin [Epsilonproteobacteria bacterium]|nr:OprO/OprP family phosphate-selective porin [Campylobacterota bacterium]
MKKLHSLMTVMSLCAVTQINAANLEELNTKYDQLINEIATMQEKESASSVMDRVSIGGYGKMDYIKYLDDDDATDKLDIYRAILYVGYQFTDNIKFVSELEWEHGGREKTGGYGIVEQAYLDFTLNEMASVKLGHVIVPVGYINLYHEATAFNAVNRPEVEKYIIPSTWHENGAILHGSISDIAYQIGIVAGLNAGQGSEVRAMRQSGQKSKADDFGIVARVDYQGVPGLMLGASVFTGDASQGDNTLDGVSTTIAEVHAGYKIQGFAIRGLYAMSQVDDAAKVAQKLEKNASGKGVGYYLNASYDINEHFTPFIRYETYNRFDEKYNQEGTEVPADDDVTNTVIGLNYQPTKNVILKVDYMIRDNKGEDDNRIELGTAYVF